MVDRTEKYVINPISGRYVKVNGRIFNALEKNAIIHGPIPKSNVLYEGKDKEDAKKTRDILKNVNLKKDDRKTYKVLNNKVTTVNKPIKKIEYRKIMISSAAEVLSESKNKPEVQKMTDDQLQKYFEREIYKKIVFGKDFEPIQAKEVVKKPLYAKPVRVENTKKKFVVEESEHPESEIGETEYEYADNEEEE